MPLVLDTLQDVLLQVKPEDMPLGSVQRGELSPEACAALTASTALHTLRLQHAELPEGALSCMFPAGRPRPLLRQLHLQDINPDLTKQSLADADLQRLVCCAPCLTGLTLLRCLHSGVSLEPLLQLPGLEHVELSHLHGDSGARVMAQLAALRRLCNNDANLSPAGLMRLSALRHLTHLHVHCSAEAGSLPRLVQLRSQVGMPLCACARRVCAACASAHVGWTESGRFLAHVCCAGGCKGCMQTNLLASRLHAAG